MTRGDVPVAGVTVNVTGVPSGTGFAGKVVSDTVAAVETVTVTVLVLSPTRAVTTAWRSVVNETRASPLASVMAELDDSDPTSVEKVIGTPTRRVPAASTAAATSETV